MLDSQDLPLFMASLGIYDDLDALYEREGISSPGDLLLYSADELTEIGFKRAHIKKISIALADFKL